MGGRHFIERRSKKWSHDPVTYQAIAPLSVNQQRRQAVRGHQELHPVLDRPGRTQKPVLKQIGVQPDSQLAAMKNKK